MDTSGLATVADNISGEKWWVIANPRKGIKSGNIGDLSSMAGFGPNWDPAEKSWENFDLEAICLGPGSLL